jgi:hypothetical protein
MALVAYFHCTNPGQLIQPSLNYVVRRYSILIYYLAMCTPLVTLVEDEISHFLTCRLLQQEQVSGKLVEACNKPQVLPWLPPLGTPG